MNAPSTFEPAVEADALDELARLLNLARTLRAEGWTVNLAVETGEAERLTLSASRSTAGAGEAA